MTQTTKTCTKCGEEKPVQEFGVKRNTADGFRSHCKVCHRAYMKEWSSRNRPKLNVIQRERYKQDKVAHRRRSREWARANRDKVLEKSRRFYLQSRQTWIGFFRSIWGAINSRTINGSSPNICNESYLVRGIELRISREEFRDWCYAHREQIEAIYRDGKRPSVDRIDPDGHYEFGNIRVLSLNENARRAQLGRRRANVAA